MVSTSMRFQSPFGAEVALVELDSRECPRPSTHVAEQALLSPHCAPEVRLAFSLGRECAHRALQQLKIDSDVPILRRQDKSPLWPEGVCGSISHTKKSQLTVAVAAAGRKSNVRSIGIDIEDLERKMSTAVIQKITVEAERRWLQNFDEVARQQQAVRIFSAKEAIFKLLGPLTKEAKTFDSAVLIPNASKGGFDLELRAGLLPGSRTATQHWVSVQESDGLVLTAVILI